MKNLLAGIFCAFLSVGSFANTLDFYLNGKKVESISLSTLKKGSLSKKQSVVGSLDQTLYNIWRKVHRTYRGYELFELLDHIYGQNWKKNKKIIFKALDGYQQESTIKDLIVAAKGKVGMVSYTETGKSGFTPFFRKSKKVDPGPVYLVWAGFTPRDVGQHHKTLKWPYQLKSIELKN